MGNEQSKQAAVEESGQYTRTSLREGAEEAKAKFLRERAAQRAAREQAIAERELAQQLLVSQASEPGELIDSQSSIPIRSLDSSQSTPTYEAADPLAPWQPRKERKQTGPSAKNAKASQPVNKDLKAGNGSSNQREDRSVREQANSTTNQAIGSRQFSSREGKPVPSTGSTSKASINTSRETSSVPAKRPAVPSAFTDERRQSSTVKRPKTPKSSSAAAPQSPEEPVVDQLQVVGEERPPRWYKDVQPPKSRPKKDSGPDVLLGSLHTEIKANHDALKRNNRDHVRLNSLRDRLHKIMFQEVTAPLLKLHRLLSNDTGLPVIFDSDLNWPFDIRADANELYNKWARRVFETDILRGIQFGKKDGSGKTDARIQPGYPKVDAKYFGNGDLLNGQWWPYQLCALRDGAHGSSQGGISGDKDEGAYSCIMAGGLDKDGKAYPDIDNGDRVQYCGTDSTDGIPTDNTKIMLSSVVNGKPVRLIRSFKAGTQYSPKEGYRYDGLYDVTEYVRLDDHNSVRQRHRCTLVRRPGQDPIRGGDGPERRPTQQELDEHKKNLKYSGRLT